MYVNLGFGKHMWLITKYACVQNTPAYRWKARALLYAYLLRIDLRRLSSPHKIRKIEQEQLYVVEKSIFLLQGLLQLAIVKEWPGVTTRLMDIQQHLLQTAFPGEPPVTQLPYVTNRLLQRYYRGHQNYIRSVQQLLSMPEEEHRTLLSSLSDHERSDVMHVANHIPRLKVARVIFRGKRNIVA